MHSLLLTLIAVAGADCGCAAPQTAGCAACQTSACDTGCDPCSGGKVGVGAKIQQARIAHPPCGGWWGVMPQTCYQPPYGCYPGTRSMSRYPAFAGTFYRSSYNYRNYFDYPWHAEMHEPTSHFSYNVEDSVPTRVPLPAHAGKANPMSDALARKSISATPASLRSINQR